MADRRLRKRRGQAVEHRLVGDFAGQADIARREVRGRSRSSGACASATACPEMWVTPRRVQPRHVIGERFSGLRQHHRAAADHGAQENLQAAIAADVVEGRPGRVRVPRAGPSATIAPVRPSSVWPTIFGAPDVPEVSISHSVARSVFASRGRTFGQADADDQLRASIASLRPIGDDGIDLGIRKQRSEMDPDRGRAGTAACAGRRRRARSSRAPDSSWPDAASSTERPDSSRGSADQAAVPENVGQRYAVPGIGDRAALQLRAEIFAQREDLTRGHFRRP